MDKRHETTLRCVLTLTVIAVVCGVLLAVLYPILYVKPSVESISKNITAADFHLEEGISLDWQIEDLNEEKVKGRNASVTMVAKAEYDGYELYGILVKTGSDGKLQECEFAFYFIKDADGARSLRLLGNVLVKAVLVKDGSTSGRTFDYALANDKKGNVKDFEDYYTVIDKPAADVYGDFDTPKCGATKTVTAVDNAFRLAADYYYYTYGGGAL